MTTNIEWTDEVWNPVTGCTKVSEGCRNCYAARMAKRLEAMGQPRYKNGFNVTIQEDLLGKPFQWKKPKKVFVNSMSDLFHDDVDEKYIAKVFAVMWLANKHTFQVLTKRPKRMQDLLNDEDFQMHIGWFASQISRKLGLEINQNELSGWPNPNIWLGVSVENQKAADERIPFLLKTPAAIRFLSCEPLLGPVDLGCGVEGIHWVIVGGESGPCARPIKEEWVQGINYQCQRNNVPFFFKQWGGVSKNKTGRLLNGQEYLEFPIIKRRN